MGAPPFHTSSSSSSSSAADASALDARHGAPSLSLDGRHGALSLNLDAQIPALLSAMAATNNGPVPGTAPAAFDWFGALVCALLADTAAARNVLTALASHAAAPYLYPSREQSREQSPELSPEHAAAVARGGADASWSDPRLPSWRGMDVLVGLAEEIVAVELPELHAALVRAALPPSLPMARWLHVHWLNVVRWRSLLAATLLPLLLGADWHAYLCVGAMRAVWPAVQRCAHPSEVHLLLLQPVETYEVLSATPYLLELRERHAERCLAALADAARR
jgi:hypothetical protein